MEGVAGHADRGVDGQRVLPFSVFSLARVQRHRLHRRSGVEQASGKLMETAMAGSWEECQRSSAKQRRFVEFAYATPKSRKRERRAIARVEQGPSGPNPRCVAASFDNPSIAPPLRRTLPRRSELENRIKEQQLHLFFPDRTSCHRWWPNWFRLLLSGPAYVLVDEFRRRGMRSARLAHARVRTIRLRILKIDAVLVHYTRRVRLHLSSTHPRADRELFALAVARLIAGRHRRLPVSCATPDGGRFRLRRHRGFGFDPCISTSCSVEARIR